MPLRESSARRMALQCFDYSAPVGPEPVRSDGACRPDGLAHRLGTDAVSAVVASKVDATVFASEEHDLGRVDTNSLEPSLAHDERKAPSREVVDASEAVAALFLGVVPLTYDVGTGRSLGRQQRYGQFLVVHSSPRFRRAASSPALCSARALV